MTTEAARNLADIAADKLDRLAEDLDASAGVDLSAAPDHVRAQVASGLRDSRNEAAGALNRLWAECVKAKDLDEADRARAAVRAAKGESGWDGESFRMVAAMWRAFADE